MQVRLMRINIFSNSFVKDIADSAQNNYTEKFIIPSELLMLFRSSCNILFYYKDDSTVSLFQRGFLFTSVEVG